MESSHGSRSSVDLAQKGAPFVGPWTENGQLGFSSFLPFESRNVSKSSHKFFEVFLKKKTLKD